MAIKTRIVQDGSGNDQTARVNNLPRHEMPKYDGPFSVRAMKISKIEPFDFDKEIETTIDTVGELDAYHIKLEDPSVYAFTISAYWVHKNKPEVGGYFVAFDDKPHKYIAADVFESEYTIANDGGR